MKRLSLKNVTLFKGEIKCVFIQLKNCVSKKSKSPILTL